MSARDRAGNESTLIAAPVAVPPPPPLTATFNVVNQWFGGGFQAEFRITNPATVPVDNWRMSFTFPGGIASMWNGVLSGSAPSYTVSAPAHNTRLDPGETAVVGMTGAFTNPPTSPTDFAFAMGRDDIRPLATPRPSPCASVQCPSPMHCVLQSNGFPTCTL